MLGRISTVTITAPDLPAAVAAYQRYLGYRVVDDGALGRDMARAWGRPQMAGQRAVLLEPESGVETYLRFVQGPAYVEHEPLSCVGWNAAELIVEDVDALADELANSPFRIIGRPADLSFSDQIRAMQVVGPAREVLYLTQIKQKLAAFDTPVAASFVDRVFIVILGGASLDALQDYYHAQFGIPRATAMPSVVSVLSAQYGLPRDYQHAIAAHASCRDSATSRPTRCRRRRPAGLACPGSCRRASRWSASRSTACPNDCRAASGRRIERPACPTPAAGRRSVSVPPAS